jgi:hypothetical protein
VVVLLVASGCLELNPAYDEGDGTGASAQDAAASSPSSSGDDESTAAPAASTGAAECGDGSDPYEPNDPESPSEVELGTYEAALTPVEDVDVYKAWVEADAPAEVFARLDRDHLQVCIYVECSGTPASIDKCAGSEASNEFGLPGCCADGVVAVEHSCSDGGFSAVVFGYVEKSLAECSPYALELGSNAL